MVSLARVLLPGKDDCLHQPTPLPVLKPYRSAITLDDLLGDRQPQPGAGNELHARRVDPEERLEGFVQEVRRNAGAAVGDGENRSVALPG